MSGGFGDWIRSLVGADWTGNGESTSDRDDREDRGERDDMDDGNDRDDRAEVALYSCRECERTYISERMESCPECGERVEPVPNERELGLA